MTEFPFRKMQGAHEKRLRCRLKLGRQVDEARGSFPTSSETPKLSLRPIHVGVHLAEARIRPDAGVVASVRRLVKQWNSALGQMQ